MRCDGCGQHRPTRFAIFCKATGWVVGGALTEAPANLCAACFEERFRAFTSSTLLLGWWSPATIGHVFRYVPGNLLEHRRARALAPVAEDAGPERWAIEKRRQARLVLVHRATGRICSGIALSLLGLLLAAPWLLVGSRHGSTAREVLAALGGVLVLVGAGVAVAGAGARRRAEVEEPPADAPPPEPDSSPRPTPRTDPRPPPLEPRPEPPPRRRR